MTTLQEIFFSNCVVVLQAGTTWSGFPAFLCNYETRILLFFFPFFKESCDWYELSTSWGTKGKNVKPEGL